jgi:hypothetical protein
VDDNSSSDNSTMVPPGGRGAKGIEETEYVLIREFVYVIGNEPGPARAGLNVFPVTPVPLKTPPEIVGVSVTGASLAQYIPFKPLKPASIVGVTVIVKVTGVPEQVLPPFVYKGIAVIVPIIDALVVFVAVKASIFPVPLAGNPIEGVVLVQLITVPGTVILKLIGVVNLLLQTV